MEVTICLGIKAPLKWIYQKKKFWLAFMKISKVLILQMFREIFAQKCHFVDRNQLHQSCMICDQLFNSDFSAAHGSRIRAACTTLSRSQCCMYDQNNYQQSPLLKLDGHLFHLFALVWMRHKKYWFKSLDIEFEFTDLSM